MQIKQIVFVFSALISASVYAVDVYVAEKHLIKIEGGFKTIHGLKYSFTSNTLNASEPTHRTDQFGDNPFEISLSAFIGEKAAVMIHAERVSDQSGASNYENLASSNWPDDSFRSSGGVCIDVPASEVEGEHDLEWLRDHGFEPVGPLVYAQYFATTADHNDEIVVTLLSRVASCETELDIESILALLKAQVHIKQND